MLLHALQMQGRQGRKGFLVRLFLLNVNLVSLAAMLYVIARWAEAVAKMVLHEYSEGGIVALRGCSWASYK